MTDYKLLKRVLENKYNEYAEKHISANPMMGWETTVRSSLKTKKLSVLWDSLDFFDEDNILSMDDVITFIDKRVESIVKNEIEYLNKSLTF